MPISPMSPDWRAAKLEFEKVTGQKKPTDKFMGVFRKSTSIDSDLKDMDAIATLPAIDAKKMQALKKAFITYKKASTDYKKLLKTAADGEATKTDLYRGVKMLSARLDKYEVTIEQIVNDDTAMAGGGADPVKKMIEAAEKLAVSATKKGLVMCVSAIKAIKASPTPKIWDQEMQPAARTLTTGLQAYKVADKKATHVDAPIKALSPYASGSLATIEAKVSKEEIEQQLAKFTAIVKDIAKDYPAGVAAG